MGKVTGFMEHGRRDPGYRPVGLLDDRAENRGALIHGCPVVGSVADLPALVACRPIRLLVLAQDL